jgi:phosphoribosylaminoimidazolecarboxamide formyltransferase / IMP cyclohydrolase
VQDKDQIEINKKELKFVTKNKPTDKELDDLIFAFKVCKFVKSNAIVIAKK